MQANDAHVAPNVSVAANDVLDTHIAAFRLTIAHVASNASWAKHFRQQLADTDDAIRSVIRVVLYILQNWDLFSIHQEGSG